MSALVEIKLAATALLAALRAVAPMQYRGDYRPHLSGTLFRAEGRRLTLVATDGYGLAMVTCSLDSDVGEKRDFLLSRDASAEVARAAQALKPRAVRKRRRRSWMAPTATPVVAPFTLRIVRGGAAVEFDTKIGKARVAVVDEQFPPFEKVIPARIQGERVSVVGVGNTLFARALEAAAHVGTWSACSLGSGPLEPVRLDVDKPIDGVISATYVLMPARIDVQQHAEAAE